MSGLPVSVGQATHSLADTAARHHIVGRICCSMYQALVEPNAVITNKEDYKAVREELALALGRSYNDRMGVSPASACKGPVPIITNIAPFKSGGANDLMAWYIKLFDTRSMHEMKQHVHTPCVVKNHSFFPPELYFAGFVMNHNAQAHPMNGDTAVTLFIGGIITIKNGRYPVKGGDRIQWYFDEEAAAGAFEENTEGMRTQRLADDLVPVEELDARTWRIKNHSYAERAITKARVFTKACRPGFDGKGATIMDWRRVIGMATGDAGPWEKVDIKICRQSM